MDSVNSIQLRQEILVTIQQVYSALKKQAKQFSEKNFGRFKDNRDLIADYDRYASCITDLLDNTTMDTTGSVIEIGPGDSPLVLELTNRSGPVVVIDNNKDMLQKTRKLLEENWLHAEQFFEGELADYEIPADLSVFNMVLHHLASPAVFFQESYRSLQINGCPLITDLTSHEQNWTRDACDDLWQGFDPEELGRWAVASGFCLGQSAYLGLKNSFQVQVRLFHKF